MMRLFAIARNACVETVRQPIYGILILVTFAVLVLDLPLSGWTMGGGSSEWKETDQQMLVNLGLSTLLVSGLLVAAFSAAGVLSREIEDRTILTVVAKPVPRALVVLGKFLGVSVALVVAYYLCSLVFLMTVRHQVMPTAAEKIDVPVVTLGVSAFALTILAGLVCNYVFGWSFSSACVGFGLVLMTLAMATIAFIGKGWKVVPFGRDIPPQLLSAMLLLLLAVLVFAAVAVAASTRLGQVMTLLTCLGFFTVGSLSQYLFGRFAEQNLAARLAYGAWPNLTFYYALDAMLSYRSISGAYLLLSGLYAVCNITAILAVGMALFQHRELEAQETSGAAPRLVGVLAWTGRICSAGLALAGLVVPSRLPGLAGLGAGAGLLLLAAAGWLVWGWFGRGVRWTYFLVLVAAAGGLLAHAAAIGGLWTIYPGTERRMAAAAVLAAVLLVLLLPKTRHHFGFVKKPAPQV